MAKFQDLDKIDKRSRALIGRLAGDTYRLYRPDYTATDNTPTLIKAATKFRVDPKGVNAQQEPSLARFETYSLFGSLKGVQSGDVLVKGTFTNPSLTIPTVTILHWGPLKEVIGLRTTKRGNIAISQDEETGDYTYLLENVLFELTNDGYPIGTLSNPMDKTGTPIATNQICMYYREELYSADYTGLTLVETDNEGNLLGRKWTLQQIDATGPVMFITVARAR